MRCGDKDYEETLLRWAEESDNNDSLSGESSDFEIEQDQNNQFSDVEFSDESSNEDSESEEDGLTDEAISMDNNFTAPNGLQWKKNSPARVKNSCLQHSSYGFRSKIKEYIIYTLRCFFVFRF